MAITSENPRFDSAVLEAPINRVKNISLIHGTNTLRVVAQALKVGWSLRSTFTTDFDTADGSETTHYVLKWEGYTHPVRVDGM